MTASDMTPNGTPDSPDDVMAAAMGEDFYAAPSDEDARLIELVGYLVQGIVGHPDEVEVEEFLDDVGSVYGVRVHAEDVGRVIGKEGRVINALRQLVKAAATKSGARVTIEIITDDDDTRGHSGVSGSASPDVPNPADNGAEQLGGQVEEG